MSATRDNDALTARKPDPRPRPDRISRPQVTLVEQGIVRIDYGDLAAVTLETSKYTFRTRCELTGGESVAVLFTGNQLVHYDRDAAEYAISRTVASSILAVAIVPKGAIARNLARLFVWYHRPPYPCRVFAAVDEALAWLRHRAR